MKFLLVLISFSCAAKVMANNASDKVVAIQQAELQRQGQAIEKLQNDSKNLLEEVKRFQREQNEKAAAIQTKIDKLDVEHWASTETGSADKNCIEACKQNRSSNTCVVAWAGTAPYSIDPCSATGGGNRLCLCWIQ